LPGYMIRLGPIFAVPALVDHQHAIVARPCVGIAQEQLEASSIGVRRVKFSRSTSNTFRASVRTLPQFLAACWFSTPR